MPPVEIPLDSWQQEPPLVDEGEFTPNAEPGFHAWNGMSPELEFAELAADIARMMWAAVVIETGVGQGYTTRRLLPFAYTLMAFESDPELRTRLSEVMDIMPYPTPTSEDYRAADLVILDSDPTYRLNEIAEWRRHAGPGCVLLVHDTAAQHPHINQAVSRMQGVYFRNPRGAFLAIK